MVNHDKLMVEPRESRFPSRNRLSFFVREVRGENMWIEILKVLGTVFVSMVTTFGGGYFILKKYKLEKEDKREEEALRKMIAEMISEADDRLRGEFHSGLDERDHTGKERFDINSKAIQENTEQISELTSLVRDQVTKLDMFAESMTSLTRLVTASAESQRTSNYDRLLFVANKVLKSGKMTISEKTNLKQLYNSWKDLKGK